MSNTITWFRGDSYPRVFRLLDKETGDPIDLTGCSAKLTVNREENPETDASQLFSVDGTLSGTPTDGKVTFILQGNEVGDFWYDIQLMGVTWGPKTIVKDQYNITQDITKV